MKKMKKMMENMMKMKTKDMKKTNGVLHFLPPISSEKNWFRRMFSSSAKSRVIRIRAVSAEKESPTIPHDTRYQILYGLRKNLVLGPWLYL